MSKRATVALTKAPEDAGVFLDFDGTLSEIVERPDAARPAQGVPELLEQLSRRFRLVAIVSGRSVVQLVEWLGPEVEIWGLHGAERSEGGRVVLAPEAESFLPVLRAASEQARARLPEEEIEIEEKGVMLGIHYRRAGDRESARRRVEAVSQEIASEQGLELGRGRMVVELKPPLDFSKAAVIRARAHDLGLKSAAFVGDDLVDLPAFDALDELEAEGIDVLRVAVDSDEAPGGLLARADVVVDGPAGVVSFLRSLLA